MLYYVRLIEYKKSLFVVAMRRDNVVRALSILLLTILTDIILIIVWLHYRLTKPTANGHNINYCLVALPLNQTYSIVVFLIRK